MSMSSPEERRDRSGGGAPLVPTGTGAALNAAFYARPAEAVARDLLGKILLSRLEGRACAGRIVETEAYTGPDDEASHAAARIGRTARNHVMFGPPGRAYVYRIYGIHWCLNAISEREGFPSGVLIRAAEPVMGIDVARERRGRRPDRDLMRGPGNLCAALAVTGELNHHPLDLAPLQILDAPLLPEAEVARGGRIGVTRAADLPLRFWLRGNPFVSRTPGTGTGTGTPPLIR
jgi:DNA-3-methyladenine glycosylase